MTLSRPCLGLLVSLTREGCPHCLVSNEVTLHRFFPCSVTQIEVARITYYDKA